MNNEHLLPLDVTSMDLPLEGSTLIEASAGTGKTYAICYIFLHLIMRKRLSPDEIMVSTFTDAATQELISRLRNILTSAYGYLQEPSEKEDPNLVKFLDSLDMDQEMKLSILKKAIDRFDKAPVSTIHGFCVRVLSEFPILAGQHISTEIMKDLNHLFHEEIHDLWRLETDKMKKGYFEKLFPAGPENFFKDLKYLLTSKSTWDEKSILAPEIKGMEGFDLLEKEVERKFKELQKVWGDGSAVEKDFNKNREEGKLGKSYKSGDVSRWISSISQWFSSGDLSARSEHAGRFSKKRLEKEFDQNGLVLRSNFYETLDDFDDIIKKSHDFWIEEYNAWLKLFFVKIVQKLPERLTKQGKLGFDNILLELRNALKSDTRKELATRIRKLYPAAIIDEFQDTDPLQYSIFMDIYGQNGSSTLFLVGDPKQSIYSFRRADIFAYLTAAKKATRRMLLRYNQRSHAEMVKAVNDLFSVPNAFGIKEIPFETAGVATDAETVRRKGELIIDGEENPHGLKVSLMEKFGNKDVAESNCMDECIGHVVHLLNLGKEGKARIKKHGNEKNLRPSDIGILCPENDQAADLQEKLKSYGVPSVITRKENVLETTEALELKVIFEAVASPKEKRAVCSALMTSLLDENAVVLARLNDDDSAMESVIREFESYHDIWMGKGFLAMKESLFHRRKVIDRIMTDEDGLRRISNLSHLFQLLSKELKDLNRKPTAFITWYSNALRNSEEYAEELQLETDEESVRIVTHHSSKGLEFPIVFLPMVWNHRSIENNRFLTAHLKNNSEYRAVFSLGPDHPEEVWSRAEMENYSESARILYVILTRAKYRCHICWGIFGKSKSAGPLKDIIYQDENLDEVQTYKKMSNAGTWQVLKPVETVQPYSSDNTYKCEALEEPRELVSPVPFWATSFSSLTSKDENMSEVELEGLEDTEEKEEIKTGLPVEIEDELAQIPAGPTTGTLLHNIMEDIFKNGTKGHVDIKEIVAKRLDLTGLENHQNAIVKIVENSMEIQLGDGKETLSGCFSSASVESEFWSPWTKDSFEAVKSVYDRFFPGSEMAKLVGVLTPALFSGYLNGKIDLCIKTNGKYWVVDWKSNKLGIAVESYDALSMERASLEHLYFLQGHIYAAALYSRLKIFQKDFNFEKDFGGVAYVYLRGLNGKGSGINMIPSPEGFVRELSKILFSPRI